MRRIERQMDNTSAMKLLINGEYGILSTVGNDNIPYGVPLSYVVDNNAIYFHCATIGSKLDNIENNNNVCFTVVGQTKVLPEKFSTEYESVIVFGNAEIINGEEKHNALKLIVKKYSPDYIEAGDEYINRAHEKTTIVKINIKEYSGKHRI